MPCFPAASRTVLSPSLPSQVIATDRSTGAPIRVNISDPDSLSQVPGTDTIVLDDQGDSALLFLEKVGGGDQHVSVLFLKLTPTTAFRTALPREGRRRRSARQRAVPEADSHHRLRTSAHAAAVPCPPIVDETTWVTSTAGHFLVADHHEPGAVYAAYTTVSSDNPTLKNTLGTLDTVSGLITPAVAGFSGPKGLIYLTP
jgi:hypothetical protein